MSIISDGSGTYPGQTVLSMCCFEHSDIPARVPVYPGPPGTPPNIKFTENKKFTGSLQEHLLQVRLMWALWGATDTSQC
eukprot:3712034-Rhodomonas_salina.1